MTSVSIALSAVHNIGVVDPSAGTTTPHSPSRKQELQNYFRSSIVSTCIWRLAWGPKTRLMPQCPAVEPQLVLHRVVEGDKDYTITERGTIG